MNKLKEKLIHWLGGVTVNEVDSTWAVRHLKQCADALYGVQAEIWCKTMYNEIIDLLEIENEASCEQS